MVYMHSMSHQNYRHLSQLYLTCFDNKRYILLLVLLLCTLLLFYLISYTSASFESLDETDLSSLLLQITVNSNRTLCSEEADRRGNGQRVIALSIFGPKENTAFVDENFSPLILPLIDEAALLFPQWTIRLYADQAAIDRLDLKNLSRSSKNIDICNVNQLPVLGNVGEYLSGKLWRFLPALDPMVDMVSSRDLDSPLTQRERAVIEQFVNSPYLFLTIRDHPLHNIPILGGLWTAALHRDRLLFLRSFSILLDRIRVQQYALANDQTLLGELIWPKVKDQTLAFDSYTCDQFRSGQIRPFPTRRSARDCHLGCVRPCCQNSSKIILLKTCPQQCRPANHLGWTYC